MSKHRKKILPDIELEQKIFEQQESIAKMERMLQRFKDKQELYYQKGLTHFSRRLFRMNNHLKWLISLKVEDEMIHSK